MSPSFRPLAFMLAVACASASGAAVSARQVALPPAAPTVALAAAPADLSTPQKALEAFAVAIGRSDYEGAVRCIEGAAAGELVTQMKREGKMRIASVTVTGVKIRPAPGGDPGRVLATFVPVIATINGTAGTPGAPETLSLRRGPDGWRIVAPDRLPAAAGLNGIFTEFSFMLGHPEEELKRRGREREASDAAARRRAADGEPRDAQEVLAVLTGDLRPGTLARVVGMGLKRTPSPAAADRAALETYLRHVNLRRLLHERDEPFVKARDGFTDEDARRAAAAAKSEAERLTAAGTVRMLSRGTRVKVLEHIIPDASTVFGSTDNELERAQKDGASGQGGAWKVELLGDPGGPNAGEIIWTVGVVDLRPSLGDAVTLRRPDQPTAMVMVATDLAAGRALAPGGRSGDAQSVARSDRLIREKRFLPLPPGTRCLVTDAATDGGVFLIKPYSGVYKGRTLFVRPEHVALADGG